MPKSEISPLFNFSLIPIHYLSNLAGRKDKRNDLKKNTPQIKIFNLRALGCQNNLSLTFKNNALWEKKPTKLSRNSKKSKISS